MMYGFTCTGMVSKPCPESPGLINKKRRCRYNTNSAFANILLNYKQNDSFVNIVIVIKNPSYSGHNFGYFP